MKGYIKVASAVPSVSIANPKDNVESICRLCQQMDSDGVVIAVFPELCITGYTCADLFHNQALLTAAKEALADLVHKSSQWQITVIVGLPVSTGTAVYNTAAVVSQGRLMGLVPKTYLPNYNEFYEKRWWDAAPSEEIVVSITPDMEANMATNQLFKVNHVVFGVEICEDLWTPIPPGTKAALAGAQIIFNLSATDALIGKYDYIRNLVKQQSARCLSGYVYASAGFGESSTDLVFDGITLIAENGRILAEGNRWHGDEFYTAAWIDISAINHDRITMSSFNDCSRRESTGSFILNEIGTVKTETEFDRYINPLPFVPSLKDEIEARCDEIINIQTAGLAQRLKATGTKNLVVGISGGLDSTLALLVAVKTFERLGLDRKGIHAITMPGFGTTDRTYHNSVSLIDALGVTFREINIAPAVMQHFEDIGHSADVKDVIYENSQARQRTYLLMDIANQVNGMVLGTGDMSELALGWATYNGDHMSLYGVNVGVPKTLVRYLVSHFAETDIIAKDEALSLKLKDILNDIVDTPISPELIPADKHGNITQKTESLVGPYDLHDFFLYCFLRHGLATDQILERATHAFKNIYPQSEIEKWLQTFIRRFFSQQFKRSCLPDGPKVGSVCLSPRGDWRMPSDASNKTFQVD